MIDLTEYVLNCITGLVLSTPGAASNKRVLPEAARLKGVCFSAYAAIDAQGTAKLYINDSDSGVLVTFPITAIQGNGMALTDSAVYLRAADCIHLVMNAGPSTGAIDLSYVLSR